MCLLDPHVCLGCMEVGSLKTGWVQGAGLIPRKADDGGAAKAEGLVQMPKGHPASYIGGMGPQIEASHHRPASLRPHHCPPSPSYTRQGDPWVAGSGSPQRGRGAGPWRRGEEPGLGPGLD